MLKDIYGEPEFINGLGYVYPVNNLEFETFSMYSFLLKFSKKHTDKEKNEEMSDFEAVVFGRIKKFGEMDKLKEIFSKMSEMEELKFKIDCFKELLKITLRVDKVEYIAEKEIFYIDSKTGGKVLGAFNYDIFRQIVMRQNIILEEKIYKDKIVEKFMRLRRKKDERNAPNISLESMVNSISVATGKGYDELKKYSYYQIIMDFQRISKEKQQEFKVSKQQEGKISLIEFAEDIDLYTHRDESYKKNMSELKEIKNAIS